MPKKLRRPLPPAVDPREAQEPPPPLVLEGGPPQPGDAPPPRRGPGRPSKAEKEAQERAAQAAVAMKPEEFRPTTMVILMAVCKAVKGDPCTDNEVDMVNGPATAVANKYAMSTRWAAELTLLGALVIVASASRQRRAEREARENPMPVDRAQTVVVPPGPREELAVS